MIKLKNYVFVNPDFGETLKEIYNTKVPVRAAYNLVKLFESLESREKEFNKVRQELLDAYGTLDEQKGQYHFEGENAQKFRAELEELLKVEYEIDAKPVSLPDSIELSPSQIQAIEEVIDMSDL